MYFSDFLPQEQLAFWKMISALWGGETYLLVVELLVILTSFYTILFICFLNYHFYGSVCSYPKAFKLDSVIDCAVKAK